MVENVCFGEVFELGVHQSSLQPFREHRNYTLVHKRWFQVTASKGKHVVGSAIAVLLHKAAEAIVHIGRGGGVKSNMLVALDALWRARDGCYFNNAN